ncbi:MAG: hypothetical protein ABSH02_01905 [Candidatus Sulfotelmatobacter sp.]|jgi:hypothetical protein
MKANLLPSLACLLSVSLTVGLATRPTHAAAPGGQNNVPKQVNVSRSSNIEVENWTKPEPGWLYVLDPKPDAGSPGERIWLIDPESAKVMGSIRTGVNADFALSPDGSRLYVASITEGDSSELAVIDTGQGVVIQRSTVQYREVANVLPAFSAMAVSGDGLALRILLDTPKSADADMFLLATFDTQTGEFLPNNVRLYNCGPGRFISHPTAQQFDFLCPRTNRIRLIRVDAESHELQNTDIVLPWDRRIGAAEAIEPAAGQDIAIVRGDGAVFQMSVDTHEFSDTAARPVLPNRIPPAAWPTSPDGSRIYLGYNTTYDRHYDNRFYLDYGRPPNLRPNDALANEFRVLDTHTWRKIGTIKTKMPFWSAVMTNDGKTLYAMAPQKHSILVIDTAKMHQARILKVGGAPALALVAP